MFYIFGISIAVQKKLQQSQTDNQQFLWERNQLQVWSVFFPESMWFHEICLRPASWHNQLLFLVECKNQYSTSIDTTKNPAQLTSIVPLMRWRWSMSRLVSNWGVSEEQEVSYYIWLFVHSMYTAYMNVYITHIDCDIVMHGAPHPLIPIYSAL